MSASPPACLVLGGRGFVGSALVHEACARGYAVRTVGRAEYEAAIGAPCDLLINANGNSRKFLSREDPLLDFKLSVESVYRSLMDFKPARYIFCSSIDVYPNVSDPAQNHEDIEIEPIRLSPYGLHKHLAEELVRYHRPDAMILRLGGFVGPDLWKSPVFDLLTGQPLRVDPDSSYPYLDTRDMARLTFDLIESDLAGGTLNVTGQGIITLRDVAEMIPDCALRTVKEPTDREHYEINIERLSARGTVPLTRDTVWRFIRDVVDGRVAIGKGVTNK